MKQFQGKIHFKWWIKFNNKVTSIIYCEFKEKLKSKLYTKNGFNYNNYELINNYLKQFYLKFLTFLTSLFSFQADFIDNPAIIFEHSKS